VHSGGMPSMGDHIDFETARAARNARYNALGLPYVNHHLRERSQRRSSAEFRFHHDQLARQGIDDELQLADFDNAYAPQHAEADARQSSDDSINCSLSADASASYKLEQSLLPAASVETLSHQVEETGRNWVTSPTGGLTSSGYSPSSTRRGAFENKFAVLASPPTMASQTPPNSRIPSFMVTSVSSQESLKGTPVSQGIRNQVSEAFYTPPSVERGQEKPGIVPSSRKFARYRRRGKEGSSPRKPLGPVSGNAEH